LKFAKDEDIKVDLKVIAISNPYGLSFTVTEEIISVTNRKTPNLEIEFILIDVPINHGNSGKPLINSGKKIIRINTFKVINTEGLGFTMPADMAKEFFEDIK
jgi:serine protease Do